MTTAKEKRVTVDWELFLIEYTDAELSDWLVDDLQRRYTEGDLDEEQLDAELDRVMNHDFEESDFERYAKENGR